MSDFHYRLAMVRLCSTKISLLSVLKLSGFDGVDLAWCSPPRLEVNMLDDLDVIRTDYGILTSFWKMNCQHKYLWCSMDNDEDFLESCLAKCRDCKTLLNN